MTASHSNLGSLGLQSSLIDKKHRDYNQLRGSRVSDAYVVLAEVLKCNGEVSQSQINNLIGHVWETEDVSGISECHYHDQVQGWRQPFLW